MLIRLTKNNQILQYSLLLLTAVVFGIKAWMQYGFLNQDVWLWLGINISTALGCGWIARKQKLSRNPGYIALLSLCLSSVYAPIGQNSPSWGFWIFLPALYSLLDIYSDGKTYSAIFNSAFFWSATVLFFPPLFFTLPCIWFIMISYSLNHWREWMSSFLGIIAPFLIFYALHYAGIIPVGFSWKETFCWGFRDITADTASALALTAGYILIAFFSIFSFRRYSQDMEITERKKSSALIVLFFYTACFALVTDTPMPLLFPLFFPLAFFCSKFFVNPDRRILKEILFAAILLLSIFTVYFR